MTSPRTSNPPTSADELLIENDDDNQSLIKVETPINEYPDDDVLPNQRSWGAYLKACFAAPLKSTGRYIYNHPFATAIGVLGGTVYGLNAGFKGAHLKEIYIKVSASMLSNAVQGIVFSTTLSLDVFKKIFETRSSGVTITAIAITAAINNAYMTYQSFAEKGDESSALVMIEAFAAAIIMLIYMGAIRFNGAKSIIQDRGPDLVNKDSDCQLTLTDLLSRLPPLLRKKLELLIKTKYADFTQRLGEINEESNSDNNNKSILLKEAANEYIMEALEETKNLIMKEKVQLVKRSPALDYCYYFFTTLITFIPAVFSLSSAAQIGYDFADKIGHFDDHLPPAWRYTIGYGPALIFLGGLGMTIFWVNVLSKTPTILGNTRAFLREYPEYIPAALFVTGINLLSGMAQPTSLLRTLGRKHHLLSFIHRHPINITSMTDLVTEVAAGNDDAATAFALIAPVLTGSTTTNVVSTLILFKLTIPESIRTLDGIIRHLENTVGNRLPSRDIQTIRQDIIPTLRNFDPTFFSSRKHTAYEQQHLLQADPELGINNHGTFSSVLR